MSTLHNPRTRIGSRMQYFFKHERVTVDMMLRNVSNQLTVAAPGLRIWGGGGTFEGQTHILGI